MSNPHQTALVNAFEGFDFNRPQDTKKSAKDSFAAHAKTAGPAPLEDKAALGAWFNDKVRPGMQAEGHNVTAVDGDKFRFNNWQGDFWVDFGRGAGAPGGALAWQAEGADDATRAAYPTPGGTPQPRGPAMPWTSGLLAQILASLQAAQQPDPQTILLQQLMGNTRGR